MKVLSLNRLIKLLKCVLVLVTVLLFVSKFIDPDSMEMNGRKYHLDPRHGLNFANIYGLIRMFIEMMPYIMLVMMECPQAFMIMPITAFGLIILRSIPNQPPHSSITPSLLAICITHVVISITLLLLLFLKAKTQYQQ